jgi:DMSO/TMAO reductase YedYZ molybdopterin-dependent catalytic subunit
MHRLQTFHTAARAGTPLLLIALWTATATTRQATAIEVVPLDGASRQVDLARLPQAVVDVTEDGAAVKYDGVLLTDVLAAAGVPRGATLRGPALSQFVVVEASDGYRVVFALAEFDKGFSDTTVLLATRRNGKPLDAEIGPMRLVVPKEERHGRWIRQIQRVTIRQAR